MRVIASMLSLLLLVCLVTPSLAQEKAKPENIVGKMAVKFTRGITNVTTSVVEIPKQTILSVRDDGAVGYLIGPLKGIGMTVYRALIGTIETAFFMVPQPGYYDPMVDPDYVWNGWGKTSNEDYVQSGASQTTAPDQMKQGE